jgi:hypothetical protein
MIDVNFYWPWNDVKNILDGYDSKYLNVVKDKISDIGIFVDYGWPDHPICSPEKLGEQVKSLGHKYKILVMLEPQALMIDFYRWVSDNENLFDMIFVHYTDWKGSGNNPEKYKYYNSTGDTWIDRNDRRIYTKKKNITAIFSNKNWLPGHSMRHELKRLFLDQPGVIDFNNPVNKIDGLKDYRYELVIDNEDSYIITEKCMDCFLTGTIPIIWSTKDHPQWKGYDTSGMIFFQSIEEAYDIIINNMANEEHYESSLKAIIHNFNYSIDHLGLHNVLYEHGLIELD